MANGSGGVGVGASVSGVSAVAVTAPVAAAPEIKVIESKAKSGKIIRVALIPHDAVDEIEWETAAGQIAKSVGATHYRIIGPTGAVQAHGVAGGRSSHTGSSGPQG